VTDSRLPVGMTAPPSPKGLRGVGLDEGHLHPGAGRVVRALGPGPAATAVPAAARRADPLAADAIADPDLRCAAHGRRPGPTENGIVPRLHAQRGMIRPIRSRATCSPRSSPCALTCCITSR
jgi:hypothetical protein